MIVQGVKTLASVVVYGALLAIGFKLGQKAYDYLETNACDDLNKLVKLTKEKYHVVTRRTSTSQETGS